MRLVTTTFILLECGNAAARRPYRGDVADLWHAMEQAGDLMDPTVEQLTTAWATYTVRPPGAAGIVDLVSFGVMRDLGIQEAFTNDAHFRAKGFQTLMT